MAPVMQLWHAERPRLGVNGRQRLFCTLQGGDLSPNHVRQMPKRRAAVRLYRAERGISLPLPGQQRLSNDPSTDSTLVRRATAWLYLDHLAPGRNGPQGTFELFDFLYKLVGRTGFEPVTFSVSGRRAPAALTARD